MRDDRFEAYREGPIAARPESDAVAPGVRWRATDEPGQPVYTCVVFNGERQWWTEPVIAPTGSVTAKLTEALNELRHAAATEERMSVVTYLRLVAAQWRRSNYLGDGTVPGVVADEFESAAMVIETGEHAHE